MNKHKHESGPLHPPVVDSRDLSMLIEQMKEMVPFYTPEWRFSPSEPDPGTALFFIVADMLQETRQRLNRAPLKNFISFLNMLDVTLLPAKPAQTHVTFSLSEGAQRPVYVPKGTLLSAADPNGEDEIGFETTQGLYVTPAQVTALYNGSSAQDRIVRLREKLGANTGRDGAASEDWTTPVPLFHVREGDDLQEHALYIRHDLLLDIRHPAVVRLELNHTLSRFKEPMLCETLTDRETVEWSYWDGDGWRRFDRVTRSHNVIALRKTVKRELRATEINGVTGRWIRCRIVSRQGVAAALLTRELELDRIRLHSEYDGAAESGAGSTGIPPEMLFHNDLELEKSGCYPFSEQFLPYGTFYISSEEAFSKKEGTITLDFTLRAIPNLLRLGPEPEIDWKLIMKRSKVDKKDPPFISILQVVWEYWNGQSWVRLFDHPRYESLFCRPSLEEAERKTVEFECPADMEPTYVNSHFNYWIRVRVLSMDPINTPEAVYLSPWIEEIGLRYEFGSRKFPVQHCMTYNNVEYKDQTYLTMTGGQPFRAFYGMDCRFPAMYMGFDQPPRKGPISMYFSLQQQKYTDDEMPLIEWEYLRKEGNEARWATLKAFDETNGFTQSGTVQFIGPEDMTPEPLFGKEHYWIRAINRDLKLERPGQPYPIANRIRMNTVKAVQQESVRNENPEWDGGVEAYLLSRKPVFAEEVWVDETGRLGGLELDKFVAANGESVRSMHDNEGQIDRLWVRWKAVQHLHESKPDDRHFTIDRSRGLIRFGDGVQGKEPPNKGLDKLRVHYCITAGEKGNVGAGQITQLHNSIAFINAVTNDEPAGGGCDTESLEAALRRGPQVVKHQNRAVTAEDYEWLIRQAYPNIAKVRCLANYNVRMEKELGHITMVILPKGGEAGRMLFPELRKQTEKFLLECAPNTVAFPEKIRVIEPAYLEISVNATVAVQSMDDIVPVELECLRKLELFLDPLQGHHDGTGWEIGETIHISVFYSLLKSISAVNHVEKLYMTVYQIEDGRRTELDGSKLESPPHGIVVGGTHKVTVRSLG